MPRPLDPDLKAKIINDVVIVGDGVRQTAERYDVDPGTVSRAVNFYKAADSLTTPKGQDIAERVYRLSQLTLDALEVQARVMADESFVRASGLRDVATAFGIANDKIRHWMAFASEYRQPASGSDTPISDSEYES